VQHALAAQQDLPEGKDWQVPMPTRFSCHSAQWPHWACSGTTIHDQNVFTSMHLIAIFSFILADTILVAGYH
jgi:hypothetical protein